MWTGKKIECEINEETGICQDRIRRRINREKDRVNSSERGEEAKKRDEKSRLKESNKRDERGD